MKPAYFYLFVWILVLTFDIMMPGAGHAADKKLYTAQGRRDPFVQLLAASGSRQATVGLIGIENVDDIRLEGIVMDVDPKKSIVMANGTVLREGEESGNVKLIRIQADGALFSVNEVEEFKPLYQDNK